MLEIVIPAILLSVLFGLLYYWHESNQQERIAQLEEEVEKLKAKST